MADELDTVIRDNAAGPAKAAGDGTSMEQHTLADQIAADKHLASKAASRKPGLGIKLVQLTPGGVE